MTEEDPMWAHAPWASLRHELAAQAQQQLRVALEFARLLAEGRDPDTAAGELGLSRLDAWRLSGWILDAARRAGIHLVGGGA